MLGQSGTVKLILCGILICGIGVVVLNFVSYNRRDTAGFVVNEKKQSVETIRKYQIAVDKEKSKDVLVREVGKGDSHILLLHGQKSSSKLWEDLGTLENLNQWGFHAFAVDIPANTSKLWLKKLLSTLKLQNLVIISPSMSGRLTIPYILRLKYPQNLIRGFVPIAPVGTNAFEKTDFQKVKVPTLVVHGEHDQRFARAYENLREIPNSDILLIKNASHASYVEKPIVFHNRLRAFLHKIYRPVSQ